MELDTKLAIGTNQASQKENRIPSEAKVSILVTGQSAGLKTMYPTFQATPGKTNKVVATVAGKKDDTPLTSKNRVDVSGILNNEKQIQSSSVSKPTAPFVVAGLVNKITDAKSGVISENVSNPPETTKPDAATDSTKSAVKEPQPQLLSKFGITLVLGPDFSTVSFVRPEKASTNVGVIVSYHFTNRWAISTGIVRARKVYGAKPDDYHPGTDYWQGRHLPDDINAVCAVLDIPVNVKYTIIMQPRQAVYVQTGLSSYFMRSEDYRYDYTNYGKPYSQHWVVKNQNQHLFRVLNVSAGYSRQVGPGISVGAEPFIKIPLAGIGAGKVNLTSMGLFFTLGYRFR